MSALILLEPSVHDRFGLEATSKPSVMEAQIVLQQLRVLALPFGVMALTMSSPVLASDAVVLVGCNLLGRFGPTALYRQSAGDLRSRNGFSGGAIDRNDDVRGRACAEVLAEVAAAGLEFREFRVIGLNDTQGIWFWEAPGP